MLDLVLIVCLHAAPMECRKERMPFEGSSMACAILGQMAAAEYIESHPKWRLSRWQCRRPEIAI